MRYKITAKGRRILEQGLTTTYPTRWVTLLEELEDGTIHQIILQRIDETALEEMSELGLVKRG
jgi:hypothetical protein